MFLCRYLVESMINDTCPLSGGSIVQKIYKLELISKCTCQNKRLVSTEINNTMEGFIFKYLSLYSVFFILCCILKVFHVIWWKPKNLEKHLKKLGIRGNSYTLLYGDMKETRKLIAEAWSKPMPLNHDIVHRVNPMWHQMFHKYGKPSFLHSPLKTRHGRPF